MTNYRTRLNKLAQLLNKRAAAEPPVIRIVWSDEATDEEELTDTMTLDGRARQVIRLRWPEDEDAEKTTR